MTKRVFTVFALLGVAYFAAGAQEKKTDQKPAASRILKIKVNYSGSGTVDEKHKIMVFLFDSPDFNQGGGGPPFASAASGKKSDTVTFTNVETSPVYVAAVFDPTGEYDGQSPPPSGASVGMYSKTPGTPEPVRIEAGATGEIELTFDDTTKIP